MSSNNGSKRIALFEIHQNPTRNRDMIPPLRIKYIDYFMIHYFVIASLVILSSFDNIAYDNDPTQYSQYSQYLKHVYIIT